ncbi:BnaC04g18820D [Brassica napus]|uniref:BnaC04g18820D protein n=2 Tax=Brassica TaxID=3705 RepID=A0A078GQ18_BRANA|nr:BnaC04g18820D [Brassica napus]VDD08715.1 unnamed protein product [Brassica oleracea]
MCKFSDFLLIFILKCDSEEEEEEEEEKEEVNQV